jgi:hypothetical protein
MSEAAAAPASAPAAAAPSAEAKPTEQTTPPGAGAQAPASPKHKVKIDGAEHEVTLDELVKGYQLEGTSRKRLSEAAQLQSEAKSLEAKLKSGGREALVAAGWTPAQLEDLSVSILAAKHKTHLDEEKLKSMDPRERENLELKKKLEEYEASQKKTTETERAAKVTSATQQITGAVIATLEQFPESVRKSPVLAARVLDAWGDALDAADELEKQGVKVSPEYVAKKVAEEFRGLNKGFLSHAKDEELDELLPATVRARLAKKEHQRANENAHPELTQKPQVREGAAAGDKNPRISAPKLLRRLSGPHS